MNLEAGGSLLHYRLVEQIGEGGMGVVWKAVDTSLGREVAIKVLPDSVAQDADRLARFEREARLLASLNHPNIATIYGLHPSTSSSQAAFIAMELVGGEDLAERIARGPLPWDEAREVALGIARALEAAHENGVIHRDLKPANVRLGEAGTADLSPAVKVLDFGLGKVFEPSARSSDPGLSPTMTSAGTQPGLILGTAAYMSPEQARGRQVDRRTDIWAFGVVLYEMLTGKSPFSGETLSDTLAAVLTRQPDLDALPAGTPPRLRRLLERCLDRDATRRLQAIGEARIALAVAAESDAAITAESASVAGSTPRRGMAFWLAGAVLLAAGMTAAFLAGRSGGAAGPATPPPAAGRFTQITYDPGAEILASLSPDGKSVVYERRSGGDDDIFLQRVGGENAINLTELSPRDDGAPAFSPDGESIAFRSDRDGGGLFVMGATGESVRRLTDFGFNPTWSPDGKQIAFATEGVTTNPLGRGTISELWVVDVGSGEKRRLYEGDAVQPDWSPSGARIAFWSAGSSGGQRDLASVPAEGGEPTFLTQDAATDWSPSWSPDGNYVYFTSDLGGEFNLWRVAVDEAAGRALGAPEPVTSSVGAAAFHADFAADGRRLAFVSETRRVNVERLALDPQTGRIDRASQEVIVGGSIPSGSADVSPDGEWLAFTMVGDQEDLFVQRVDGTQRRRLTRDPAKDRLPRWFPDGERILFYSDRSGSYQLWTIRPDGSDMKPLAGQPEKDNLLAEIAPDGRRISMTAFRDNAAAKILTLDANANVTDVETLPAPAEGISLQITSFSPSGRHVTGELRSMSYEGKGVGVYDFETGTHRKLADDGFGPTWLDDRRVIYALADTLYLVDVESGAAPRALYTLSSGNFAARLTLALDRGHLYFDHVEREADVWMLALPGSDIGGEQP